MGRRTAPRRSDDPYGLRAEPGIPRAPVIPSYEHHCYQHVASAASPSSKLDLSELTPIGLEFEGLVAA